MPEVNSRKFLADELGARLAKNPAYSIRAFARDLGISKTHLSGILQGKRTVSPDLAENLAARLDLSPTNKELFLDLVEVESNGTDLAKRQAQRRLNARFIDIRQLDPKEFNLISEWHFMPLLELFSTQLENHTPEYIGKRLGISAEKAQESLDLLLYHGFLSKRGDRFVLNQENTTTSTDIPSSAIRNYYRQTLSLANAAIEEQGLAQRDFSVGTFALNKKKIAMVKERVTRFRRELALELAEDSDKDAVYTMSICIFENTKGVL